MIVLYKLSGQSQRFELIHTESLGKKPAPILKDVGNDHNYIIQAPALNSNLHVRGYYAAF